VMITPNPSTMHQNATAVGLAEPNGNGAPATAKKRIDDETIALQALIRVMTLRKVLTIGGAASTRFARPAGEITPVVYTEEWFIRSNGERGSSTKARGCHRLRARYERLERDQHRLPAGLKYPL
jgi:hypothetical protein